MWVWFVLLIIFLAILSPEYFAWRTGVPTVASFRPARKKIIEILQKHFGSADTSPTIIDLGSGNGQLTRQIALTLPKANVIGIEISFMPWLISKLRQLFFGPRNLHYQRVDFWSYDCGKVDAVVLFLTDNVLDRISQKLAKELKTGALVVSNECPLTGDWQPIETVDTGLFKCQIFVYQQCHDQTLN